MFAVNTTSFWIHDDAKVYLFIYSEQSISTCSVAAFLARMIEELIHFPKRYIYYESHDFFFSKGPDLPALK